ncbi:response regulator [Candidatus Dependentiae bacterium]|nr:response regulator [Candidatus Dependentiae bacterium]
MDILLIDENIDTLSVFKKINIDFHLEIDYADQLNAAKRRMKKHRYFAIFLDIKLGDESGLELVEDIKKGNLDANLIVISNYKEFEFLNKISDLGTFNFLKKPINLEVLRNIFYDIQKKKQMEADIWVAEEMRFLFEINKIFFQEEIFSDAAQHLLYKIIKYSNSAFGGFIIYNEPDDMFSYFNSSLLPEIYKDNFLPSKKAILKELLNKNSITFINTTSPNLLGKSKLLNISNKYSVQLIPLKSQKENIGFILLGKEIKESKTNMKKIQVLHALSSYIGLRFEKEFLFKKLSDELSEKLLLEKQLIESGKLAAIGELAAGLSHEINNPLGIISAFAQLLLRKEYIEKDDQDLLQKIVEQSLTASAIIQKVLNLSRKNTVSERMSIHSVITNSIELIEHYYKNLGIKITTIFNAEDDIVFGNIIDFQEIFLNLFSNAKDAIEHDGEIKIITKNTNLKNQKYIFLEIQDTGSGIAEENLNKIFEPFFTTKEVGLGTGLGLSLILKIINNYNGLIDIKSEVGKGTTFQLHFKTTKKSMGEKDEKSSLSCR